MPPKTLDELKSRGFEAMRGGGHGHGHSHDGGHIHDSVDHCDEAAVREAMQQRNERIANTERVATFLKAVTGVGGAGAFLWFLMG